MFGCPQEDLLEYPVAVLKQGLFADEVIDGMPLLPSH
jgi:hypothetical protein